MQETTSSDIPWYSEEAGIFGPGYLREYRNNLNTKRTAQEVDFLEKILGLKAGTKILDCPCGHGRHSIELAKRGYTVTGQDLNGFFLNEAEAGADTMGVSVRWVKGDMRTINFKDEFDVALNLFTSFGYLESDDENQKALQAAVDALKKGGLFVLDVANRDHIVRMYHEQFSETLPDGSEIITKNHFDHLAGRNVETRIRSWANGEQETFSFFVRMYTPAELATMFRDAGLTISATFGNYLGDPLSFDSERCIFVGKKD